MNTPIEELAEKINYCIENHIDLSKVSLRLKINGVEGEISIPNPEVDFIWIRDKPGKNQSTQVLSLFFHLRKENSMLQESHKTITLSEFYNFLKENQKVGMRQWVKLYTVVNGNSHDRLIDGRVYFYELKGYMDIDELKDLHGFEQKSLVGFSH